MVRLGLAGAVAMTRRGVPRFLVGPVLGALLAACAAVTTVQTPGPGTPASTRATPPPVGCIERSIWRQRSDELIRHWQSAAAALARRDWKSGSAQSKLAQDEATAMAQQASGTNPVAAAHLHVAAAALSEAAGAFAASDVFRAKAKLTVAANAHQLALNGIMFSDWC